MYNILETHIVYKNGKLQEVAVLWDDQGAVRATFSDNRPKGGYHFLKGEEEVSSKLFQEVAGTGSYLDDELKSKYFPGDRPWSR